MDERYYRDMFMDDVTEDYKGPQWALIAVSVYHDGATVVACSPGLGCDIKEAGIDASDMWSFEEKDFGKIFRWDGRIVVTKSHEGDFDVDYEGSMREATEEDLKILLEPRPPKRIDIGAPYIPANLDDAIRWLNDQFSSEEILTLDNYEDEEDFIVQLHHGTGRQLRNRWKLWDNEISRLAQWFNSIGIRHADDMSSIVLTSFYRTHMKQPINLGEQVAFYQEYWANGIEFTTTPREK